MNSLVLDLDTLIYIVAYQQYKTLDNKGDADKVKAHVRDFVSNVMQVTKSDEYIMFYQGSQHSNYRNSIADDYKANRGEEPDFYTHWKDVIYSTLDELGAVSLKTIESDDAVAIIAKMYKDKQIILGHNDKDMLQIPGNHYFYTKNEFVVVTEEEAKINLYKQLLTGDSTDNIIGCGKKVRKVYKSGVNKGKEYYAREGVGPKTAIGLLENSSNFVKTTITEYKKVFGVEWKQNLLKTYKLIGLLGPDQTLEKFDTTFKPNENLTSLSTMFTSVDELF